jgi:hypothetical protein
VDKLLQQKINCKKNAFYVVRKGRKMENLGMSRLQKINWLKRLRSLLVSRKASSKRVDKLFEEHYDKHHKFLLTKTEKNRAKRLRKKKIK